MIMIAELEPIEIIVIAEKQKGLIRIVVDLLDVNSAHFVQTTHVLDLELLMKEQGSTSQMMKSMMVLQIFNHG